MENNNTDTGFATKAVHSGMVEIEGAASTPIFLSSTYRLTDEKYKGWAEGLHHSVVYSRISSINSEVVSAKLAALEGAEDAEGAKDVVDAEDVLLSLIDNSIALCKSLSSFDDAL